MVQLQSQYEKNCKQHKGVKSKDCSDIVNIGRVAWLEK